MQNIEKLVLIGGGGHARVVISAVKKLNRFEIVGYVALEDQGPQLGVPFLGNDGVLESLIAEEKAAHAVIGIGHTRDNALRRRMHQKLAGLGYSFPVIVSTDATVNRGVTLDPGTVVMDGAVIQPGSRVGAFSIINTHASVDHDCEIGRFVHVAPGAVLSGSVRVGDDCLLGAGCTILQERTIHPGCIIGAGAVVVNDCTEKGTYTGIPARRG